MRELFNNFIKQQGEHILRSPIYAYGLIVLFAVFPFMTWLSVSIIAFLTLRFGAATGAKALVVGLLTCSVMALFSASLSFSNQLIIMLTFLPCFFSAWLLRLSADWNIVAACLLVATSLVVMAFYYFPPNFLVEEYQLLLSMMKDFQSQGVKFALWLTNPVQAQAYLLGVQAASSFLSALMSLVVARAMQASLFYPAGLKKELLSYRAYTIMLVPFAAVLLGLYMHATLALSLMPIWVIYFSAAGYSTLAVVWAANQPFLMFALLVMVTLLLPRIFVPFIVSVGILDNILHFRSKFNKRSSKPKSSQSRES